MILVNLISAILARVKMERKMFELNQAVLKGDLEQVKKIIKGGMFSNPATKDEISNALLDAIGTKNYLIVLALVQAGADVNGHFTTPLLLAVKSGNLDIVQLLCKHGATLPLSKDGNHPLWYAVYHGDLPIVKYFIEDKKCPLIGQDIKGDDIFAYARHKNTYDSDEKKRQANEKKQCAVEDYLKQQAEPIKKSQLAMVSKGDLEALKQSLDTELSENFHENSLLTSAVSQGQLHIVKYLIQDRKIKTRYSEYEILGQAVNHGQIAIVKYFLEERKIDVNQGDHSKCMVLLWAIYQRNLVMIKYLVDKGARLDRLNETGTTALIQAASRNDLPTIKYLVIDRKVKVDQTDDQGNTALLTAASGGYLEVMQYLVAQGADVNKSNSKGSTALLEAARGGHVFVLKYLREEIKCALDVRDKSNQSVFDYGKNHQAVLLYLNTAITNNTHKVDDLVNPLGKISVSLTIPQDKIIRGDKLGEGGFGIVYRAKWQGTDVAVKTLHINNFNQDTLDDFKNEASIMANLRHKNIIMLYGICVTQPYSMVMELAAKGSLSDVLKSNANSKTPMDWSVRLKIAVGAVNGIAFLHNQTPKMILHRDIKSMNLLLDDTMNPKWTDFGLAKVKDTAMTTSSNAQGGIAGTLPWMAPELLDGSNTNYTAACDVYSLSILLWEIASGILPYAGIPAMQIYASVVMRGERQPIPKDCPVKFANVISDGWMQLAGKRIKIPEMLTRLEGQYKEASTNISGYMSLTT